MISPAQLFMEGGPAMAGVLGLGVFAAIATLVLAVPAILRVRIPALVWLFLPCAVAVAGAAGTVSGVREALAALMATTPEQTALLAAQGMAIALFPWLFGLVLAAALMILVGWVAAVAHLIGGGKKASTTLGHAALPLLLGLLAGAAGAALARQGDQANLWLLPVAAVLGSLPIAVASTRTSDETRDAARLAGARALVGTCATLAALAAVAAVFSLGRHDLFQTIAMAGPEARLLVAASQSGVRTEWMALVPGLVALAAVAAVVPVSQHLGGARTVVGAVAALIVVGLPVTGTWVMGTQLAELEDAVWGGEMVYAMAGRVGELPRPQRADGSAIEVRWPPLGTCLVEEGSRGWRIVRREHGSMSCPEAPAPASLPLEAGVEPLVVVKGETPARQLAESRWQAGSGVLHVLTMGPEGPADLPPPFDRMDLGSFAIAWAPLEVALDDPGTTWVVRDTSSGTLVGSVDAQAVVTGMSVASSLETLPEEIERVVLVPGPHWTVQDLLSLCDVARGGSAYGPADRCVVTSGVEWAQREARLAPAPPPRVTGPPSTQATVASEPVQVRGDDFLGARSEGSLFLEDDSLRTEQEGARYRKEIEAGIQRHQSQIRVCYQRQLAYEPQLQGKVTVRFTIAKDGTVSSARIASSTLHHAEVESCVIEKLMRMSFPPPSGGEVVDVTYPFIFSQE